MLQPNEDDELRLRQYLLGTLPEEAQRACEARYLASDDDFQAMLAAENELAYDYAQGVLTADERHRYEERFLQHPEHRRRAAIARGVLAQLPGSARVRVERRPWLRPVFAWGAAAALVLLATTSAWLLVRTVRLQRELASVRTAPAAVAPQSPAPSRPPLVVSTVLVAGRVRGEAEAAVIVVPPDADLLRIQVVIDAPAATELRGAVRNADGAELWAALQSTPPASKGHVGLTFDVPAPLLGPGDYELAVAAATSSNTFRALAEYDFRVSRSAAPRR